MAKSAFYMNILDFALNFYFSVFAWLFWSSFSCLFHMNVIWVSEKNYPSHTGPKTYTHPPPHTAKSFYPPYTAKTPCPSMLLTDTYLSLHCFWIVHASLLVTLVYCRAASMKKKYLLISLPSVPTQSHMTHEQVHGGDDEADQGNGEPHLEEVEEGELASVLLCHPGADYVGGGADQGAIAAQASPQGQGPSQRLQGKVQILVQGEGEKNSR